MAAVRSYLNYGMAARTIAGHYGEPVELAQIQVRQVGLNAEQAGF
jgi:hypothetical protein